MSAHWVVAGAVAAAADVANAAADVAAVVVLLLELRSSLRRTAGASWVGCRRSRCPLVFACGWVTGRMQDSTKQHRNIS